jgi:transposase
MTKSTRARYTLEFKEEAVRLVAGDERVATVARNLGLSEQTLHNCESAPAQTLYRRLPCEVMAKQRLAANDPLPSQGHLSEPDHNRSALGNETVVHRLDGGLGGVVDIDLAQQGIVMASLSVEFSGSVDNT